MLASQCASNGWAGKGFMGRPPRRIPPASGSATTQRLRGPRHPPRRTLHRPVLYLEPFEPGEIFGVDSDEHEPVGMSDGSDLPIRVWRGSAKSLETCPFATVPRRRDLVVGKDRKRRLYDVMEIGFKSGSALPPGQPTAAVGELVPHRRRDGALMAVLAEPPDDLRVGGLGGRRGYDARVQKIPKRHSETSRPTPFSRADAAKSSSRPTWSSECFLRKLL